MILKLLLMVFVGSYTASSNPTQSACGECGDFSSPSGCVTSKNFPQKYSNYVDCDITIQPSAGREMEVKFTHFDLENETSCRYDYLKIREEGNTEEHKHCGNILPSSITTRKKLHIKFHSDRSIIATGYKIEWTSLPVPGEAGNDTLSCNVYRGEDKLKLSAAMHGYDVWKANPWAPSGDPGVRKTIFRHECTDSCSSQGYYHFVEVKPDHACSKDFSVETITTFHDYMAAQTGSVYESEEVSGSTSVATPSVSASASYSTSSSSNKEHSNLKKFFQEQQGEVSLATAACYTNDVQVNSYIRPLFHDNFIAALEDLNKALSGSTSAQEAAFTVFIEEFGTHYTEEVDYGATLIHSTFYKKKSENSQQAAKRNGCNSKASEACLEGGGGGITGSASAEACYAKEAKKCEGKQTASASGGTNAVETTKTQSFGSRPLKQGDWITSNFKPVPVKRKLRLISTLFKNKWLTKNSEYRFRASLDGVGLKKLFNSLVVDYCSIVLRRDRSQCQQKLVGCGINDDCGFDYCINMPTNVNPKGYECGFTNAPCDKTATTLVRCRLDIKSTWIIQQDTVLRHVKINCKTTGPGCIYINRGKHLTIQYSSADGDGSGRFIEMAATSKLTLAHVKVKSFSYSGYGAAIYAPEQNIVTITGTTFEGNEASHGGAVLLFSSQLTLNNNQFISNKARSNDGGGVYASGCNVNIKNTKFISNHAKGTGGGMYLSASSKSNKRATLDQVTFQSNTAGYSSLAGGGLYTQDITVVITHSTFTGNTATEHRGSAGIFTDRAGAISITRGDVTIDNTNTFYNNGDPKGKTIQCQRATLNIPTHSVIKALIYNYSCTIN